ncbi:MAG: metallophosphoesterase [Vicinamibacterales bacterium]
MGRLAVVTWSSMAGGLAIALMFYMARIAPRWIETVKLNVGIPGLPPECHGVRIAHLSDFHVGSAVPTETLHHSRQIALDFMPDIVALTGDFFNEGVVVDSGDLFTNWPARARVFAVLGNHDYRGPVGHLDRLLHLLADAGVTVLRNESIEIDLNGHGAWIVGVDDPFTTRMDDAVAFDMLPADAEALLYLAHSPAAAITIPEGRARIMLCGHTHGGQLRIVPDGRVPFVKLARWLRRSPRRLDPLVHRGIHWTRGAVLIVSNGLGVSKLPLRFRTRPQVILIELIEASVEGPPCDDVRRYVQCQNPTPRWLRWLS